MSVSTDLNIKHIFSEREIRLWNFNDYVYQLEIAMENNLRENVFDFIGQYGESAVSKVATEEGDEMFGEHYIRKRINVTPLVRCKDCVYCYEGHYEEPGEPEYIKRHCTHRFNRGKGVLRQPLDFCSYGVKKRCSQNIG